jgi:hypothetical protein
MKRIKTYESFSIDERTLIVNECEDIFYDLIHDGSSIDVSFPRKKTYSQEPADILRIVFNDRTPAGAYVPRTSFNPLKYIDDFYHLDNFLKSKGYRYFSDGSCYDTHEKLMKSFERGGDLLLLQISYIKE